MAKPKASRHTPEEVDAYLAELSDDVRAVLEELRAAIRQTAPDCTERVSYGIPIFRLHRDLVGISAHRDHCSLHSMSPSLMKAMADELTDFSVSGATIHFTPDAPLPKELVVRIVQERMRESGSAG